ncbi:MAG: TIGR01244 family sulfur transferase [Pseudomonadota bacterium]
MDIRTITPAYAVTPQIEPEDLPAIKAAGYATVICNRPDAEVPVELRADVIRAAVEAAGLTFVDNPLVHTELSTEHVSAQGAAQADAAGPVLAYCASGTRSSILWSLSKAGVMSTDDILAATAQAGYDLAHIAPQIEALARR